MRSGFTFDLLQPVMTSSHCSREGERGEVRLAVGAIAFKKMGVQCMSQLGQAYPEFNQNDGTITDHGDSRKVTEFTT